jgi:hypothetical protein
MQRLLQNIFFISYIITFTFIYGNLIALLMKQITKELPLQNIQNNTLPHTTSKLIVHYPTLLMVEENVNPHNMMF